MSPGERPGPPGAPAPDGSARATAWFARWPGCQRPGSRDGPVSRDGLAADGLARAMAWLARRPGRQRPGARRPGRQRPGAQRPGPPNGPAITGTRLVPGAPSRRGPGVRGSAGRETRPVARRCPGAPVDEACARSRHPGGEGRPARNPPAARARPAKRPGPAGGPPRGLAPRKGPARPEALPAGGTSRCACRRSRGSGCLRRRPYRARLAVAAAPRPRRQPVRNASAGGVRRAWRVGSSMVRYEVRATVAATAGRSQGGPAGQGWPRKP